VPQAREVRRPGQAGEDRHYLMETYSNKPTSFADPHSGIGIIRLVPGAALSIPLSYDWPSVMPDNRHAVVRCEFAPASGRPSGFYRVRTDGAELAWLCEGGIHPRLTPDGRALYTLRSGDPVLRRVDVQTGRCDDVCNLERVLPPGWVYVQMRLSPTSNHLFVLLREPDIVPTRVDLNTGEAVRLDGFEGMVWACCAEEPRVIVVRMRRAEKGRRYTYMEYRKLEQALGDRSLWSVDLDGGEARLVCVDTFSHATVLGRTSRVQGCGKWGDRSITICGEGGERRTVCRGPYFWHSGASFDAEWIIADTNWPDYGIQLVHVPTGNFRYLCYSGSSLGNGLVHPHPSLSNDGRIALFRSDREGEGQAYLVRIPEEFREAVKRGECGDCAPVWPART